MSILSKIAIVLGLSAATLAAAPVRDAAACGGYVHVPTPEEEVQSAAFALIKDTQKVIHAIEFLDDGTAEVQLRWPSKSKGRVIAQYVWFVRGEDGAWKVDGKSYAFTLPARSTRAKTATAAR